MAPFRIEASHDPRGFVGGLMLLVSGALLLGGIIAALSQASLAPLLASLAGGCLFAWLLPTDSKHQYRFFVALAVDESGIEYALEPNPKSPRARFGWSEIVAVRACLASQGADPQGLEVVTCRYGRAGTPLFVPVGTEGELRSAVEAARLFKAAYAENKT